MLPNFNDHNNCNDNIISIDIKSTGLQVKVQNLDQNLFIISKTVEDHKLRVFFIVFFYRIECFLQN